MLAARIHEDGGPEVLRVEEVPDPVAGPGQVLVRLRAASLNHLDVWVRKGLPSVPKPRILGADGAGIVEAVGDGVDGLEPGQRVVLNPGMEHGDVITVIGEHCDGTHAELIAVDDAQVYPLDDSLSFEAAAAFPLVYETAYRMLVTRAAVREGEWGLIWGIGGGVATAAFEICRALGLKTIVTSGSDDKLARAVEWGADVAVNHAKADVPAAVREATGKGVDVVVETVGEATWARSLAAVRSGGRVVVCGATSGPNPPGAAPPLLVEAADGAGLDDGHARRLPRRLRARPHRTRRGSRRPCLSARRDPRGARAPRSRRAAREDRALHPRLTSESLPVGAGSNVPATDRPVATVRP